MLVPFSVNFSIICVRGNKNCIYLQADLIHLGAKYSPCMRKDANVEEAMDLDKQRENQTACCIRNDGSGCVQSSRGQCSVCKLLYEWGRPGLSNN